MSNAVAGKLIQIIKSYPVLYDPNNTDYRTKEVVEPLWQEIALELNENDMELRKRWRNLRDTYVRLLRLIKNSENDEVFRAAATRKYHKWVWTREMEFFRPYLTAGNKLGELNLSIQGVECNMKNDSPKEKPNERSVRATASRSKKYKKESSSSPPTVSVARKLKQSSIVNQNARMVHSTRSVRLEKAQHHQSTASISNQTELDATDRLFLAHSQSIKQFSSRRQAITKLKIAEVIMEQEILDQEEKDHNITRQKYKEINTQDEDTTFRFETVCGYDTDEADVDEVPYIVTNYKKETYEQDPVDDDEFSN